MNSLDRAQIAIKSVEISKSMINVPNGLHNYDLRVTRQVGDTARFSAVLRNTGSIDSEKLIAAIGAALKLDYNYINMSILPLMEEYGWLNRIKDGKRLKRLDEEIPPIEDVLNQLGSKWEEEEPGDIERGTVYSLSQVSGRPTSRDALISETELSEVEFQTVLDYGTSFNYLGVFSTEDTGSDFIWSPLYWNGKIETISKYLEKQGEGKLEELGHLSKNIMQEPGIPKENLSKRKAKLVDAGIYYGFFNEVQITDRSERSHQYIFPPSPHFAIEPKGDIFEKARMIVACIRHGQHHAEITRVLYPLSILRAIKTSSMKPHPYAAVQYLLLKLHGVVNITPTKTQYGDAYRITWIDSPENNSSADIAEQLLKGEDVCPTSDEEIDAQKILVLYFPTF